MEVSHIAESNVCALCEGGSVEGGDGEEKWVHVQE